MKQFTTILRLAVVSSTALGLATVASWYSYRSYWHSTIRRVQTVDFNILSHVLPTKLSYILINQDLEELQRTLDSSYGYFGMVVTDCVKQEAECPKQKILYSTDSKFSWKQQLNTEALSDLPYNVLKNPPPLQTEAGFKSARSEIWKTTGIANKGQIIGRVYYVRGIPPKFSSDLADWIKKFPGSLLAGSGADKYYSLTFGVFFFSGIALWGGIEFVLYRKKVLEQIAQERQRRLEIEQLIARDEQKRLQKEKRQALFEAEGLRKELIKREKEISTLITQREKILAESVNFRDKTQQQAQQLEDEIIQTESKLKQSQQEYERELAEKLQDQAGTEEMLLAQKQVIAQLQQKQQEKVQISEQLHSELAKAQNRLEELQHDLLEQTQFVSNIKVKNDSNEKNYRQEIYLKEQVLKQVQEELIKTRKNGEKQKQLLDKLKNDKNVIEQRYQALNEKLELNVKKLLQELQKTKAELIEQKNIQEYLKLLEEENDEFRQEVESMKVQIDKSEITKLAEQSKYKSLEASCREYQQLYYELKEKISVYRRKEVQSLDLCSKTVAFIGGDKEVRERIIKDLQNDFNLRKYIEIPPSWERKMDLSSVKLKIGAANFIFHFTARTNHDSQNILREIKHKISGHIIQINSPGYSGGLRNILEYLAYQV